jgi:putative MFS transporter
MNQSPQIPNPQPSKTVQQYIDETPHWEDGTSVASTSLTAMQWRIWSLASAGKFFEGLVVFMTGVALPLIVYEFQLDAAQKGVIGAAVLFGILVGATALGSLADVFGRKRMFIAEMVLFVIFLLGLVLAPSFVWVAVFLFGIGTALGCDYPTAHMVISESIPSRSRGRLVLGAFAFQAVGALTGTVVGYLVLSYHADVSDWRMMYATAIVPGILVVIGRFFIIESPLWLVLAGRISEAEREMARLLAREPKYPKEVRLKNPQESKSAGGHRKNGYTALFSRKHRRATIFASVPWFLQDLGTYGIGIFTPTILAASIGAETEARNIADLIHNDVLAAKGTAFLDILLLVGIVFAVLLTDRVGRIRLQVFGFIGCAAGLLAAAVAGTLSTPPNMVLIFIGFMLFNFSTNVGPNAQTYLLAGEVFPTHIRGRGAGFAASFAKIGGVMTAFLFPMLLVEIGTNILLYILVSTSLLGAFVTWRFQMETRGISLERIGMD